MSLNPTSDLLIVTSHPPEWDELAAITCESHAAYAKARGYDYHVDRSSLMDRHNGQLVPIRGFVKFDLLLHFLPHYKYVVWLDADLIVTDHRMDFREQFAIKFSRRHVHGVLLGYDWNSFNSTVIACRSTDEVWAYLWACNNTGRNMFLDHGWHEMQSLKYFSQFPPYKDIVDYESCKVLAAILPEEYEPHGVPRRVMEPYAWAPGDFAVHLSALSLPRRIELANFFKENVLLAT